MFENVSWEGISFTKLVNMIIDFVLAIVKGEFPLIGELLGKEESIIRIKKGIEKLEAALA